MALGCEFVGAANHPGVFRGTVLAQLFEEFLETGVEHPLGAVAMKRQREVVGRRHGNT
jgi:hypothetical protein